jgi:hypothetical protein
MLLLEQPIAALERLAEGALTQFPERAKPKSRHTQASRRVARSRCRNRHFRCRED